MPFVLNYDVLFKVLVRVRVSIEKLDPTCCTCMVVTYIIAAKENDLVNQSCENSSKLDAQPI